nr:MAG TPA: hypothetical protein [Caudoviricetes sp.]
MTWSCVAKQRLGRAMLGTQRLWYAIRGNGTVEI